METTVSVDELFQLEYTRLVRSLAAWVRRVAMNRLLNDRRNRRRRAEILAAVRVVDDGDMTTELLDLRRAVGSEQASNARQLDACIRRDGQRM